MTSGRQCSQSPSFQPLTKRNEGSGDENELGKERDIWSEPGPRMRIRDSDEAEEIEPWVGNEVKKLLNPVKKFP